MQWTEIRANSLQFVKFVFILCKQIARLVLLNDHLAVLSQ
jgi:hypothetical protein